LKTWAIILGGAIVLCWMIFVECRINFLYLCMDKSANSHLMQNDINSEIFERFGELKPKWRPTPYPARSKER